MIPFEKALETVFSHVRTADSEHIPLMESLGRILAEDIRSDTDIPPFDKSAMDGFACRIADIGSPLKVIETIQAGESPVQIIGEGKCARIMTGARIPQGADCVVMIEMTEEPQTDMIRVLKDKTPVNIMKQGEDIRKGDLVLKRGTRIGPSQIAVLAAAGMTVIPVYQRPSVTVIPTGHELVEPGSPITGSKIRNTNAYHLMAQVKQTGITPAYHGIADDTLEDLNRKIQKALNDKSRIIILSGGVSMGDFDLVPQALEAAGFKILFDSVAVQPGKPLTFAVRDDAVAFGLPGNPVSTFFLFELVIRAYIYRTMGHTPRDKAVLLELGEDFSRKKSDRLAFLPVQVRDNVVYRLDYNGSAHIHSLQKADGIMEFPLGLTEMKKGEKVHVRPL